MDPGDPNRIIERLRNELQEAKDANAALVLHAAAKDESASRLFWSRVRGVAAVALAPPAAIVIGVALTTVLHACLALMIPSDVAWFCAALAATIGFYFGFITIIESSRKR